MSTWTGPGRPVPGDVECLGQDAGEVVGVTHEVVVLGHRQGDAGDVDLLEGVLAQERGRDVAGDGDHRDGVELGVGDPGDEVRGGRARGAQADANLAGGTGVPVRRMGGALLVADEHVAQVGVVAQHVVEGQDDPARVAEQDVDALAEDRLHEDVGADPGALAASLGRIQAGPIALVEHPETGLLDGLGGCRPGARHVAAARAASGRRCARCGRQRRCRSRSGDPPAPLPSSSPSSLLTSLDRSPATSSAPDEPAAHAKAPAGLPARACWFRSFVAPSAPSEVLQTPAGSRQ